MSVPNWIRRVLLFLLLTPLSAGAESGSGEVDGYRYYFHPPQTRQPTARAPLAVVLHGCRQTAEDIRILSRFDRLGSELGFAVLFPETRPSLANPRGCWKWWDPDNQVRGQGEPQAIVSMVERVVSEENLDPQRVYVLGLSSGGAMSAILGALYPDRFAAVGVHSGIAFAGASTAACALRALEIGALEAEPRATVAYHAQGERHRVMPIMVIQGSADEVVLPINADALIRQFAQLNDLADDGDGDNQSIDASAESESAGFVEDGYDYTIRNYHDARGLAVISEISVEGLGHAWSGGPAEAEYSDPAGPDASRIFWEFVARWSLTQPPMHSRPTKLCRDKFSANLVHSWRNQRMSDEEFRCNRWRLSWRRAYEDVWTGGRCP